ncbi:MAG: WbqC family protein [Opitutales bacterium]
MKKVAIHQPNFIPWLGYFYKMHQCDTFIILDDVQESNSHSYFYQAFIKNTTGSSLTISIPRKSHSQNTCIKDVQFADNYKAWLKKFSKTLQFLYKKAPFFENHYENILKVMQKDYSLVYEMNVELIKYCAKCLNINCEIILASTLHSEEQKEGRILDLVKKVNGDCYISGKGAKNYQTEENFSKNNIQLKYSDFSIKSYPQVHGNFVGGLSVIDFLFNTNAESENEIW